MTRIHAALILPILSTLITAAPAHSAQFLAPAADVKTLLAARSLKCSFPFFAQADWDRDEPRLRTGKQTLVFQVDNINLRDQTARLIGNVGSADLVASRGTDSIAFTQATTGASLHLTTVFAWRDKRGAFKAIHSRHSSMEAPAPNQNYGYCQAW